MIWALRLIAIGGLLVVAGVWVTEWGGVWHGHPLYGSLLFATALICAFLLFRSRRRVADRTGLRLVLRWVGLAALIGWLGLMAWLRPLTAEEPALLAMESSDSVQVTEWPTEIILRSSGDDQKVGLFFQPGAKADARAYAAVLRPLAEAGYLVVIPKQPLGIGFLAVNTFDVVAAKHPYVRSWVLGGHSLGGTVAAIDADEAQPGQVAGLLFYASYPAGDMSDFEHPVLSISAEQDGLATPAKIEASATDLPVDTTYLEIEGAVHAFFGDYGDQSGDGTPQISHDAAREVITSETLAFMDGVSGNR